MTDMSKTSPGAAEMLVTEVLLRTTLTREITPGRSLTPEIKAFGKVSLVFGTKIVFQKHCVISRILAKNQFAHTEKLLLKFLTGSNV